MTMKMSTKYSIIILAVMAICFFYDTAVAKDNGANTPLAKSDVSEILEESPRKVFVHDKSIFVDGEEFYVRGINYSMSYPKTEHYSQIPKDVFEADMIAIREAGFNTIKTYEMVPDWMLDLIEAEGLMLIETVCFPSDWTDFDSYYDLKNLKKQALANVERHKARKGILAWSIWNDGPFTHGNKKGNVLKVYPEKKVNAFLEELYLAIKKSDPYHPITASNLVEDFKGERLGFPFLDIFSFNVYLGIENWLVGEFSNKKLEDQISRIQTIMDWTGKPAIVAETGYSSYLRAHGQGEILRSQINAINSSNMSGFIVFQWADDWNKSGDVFKHDDHIEEHWGIVTGYRKEKDGYEMIKNILDPASEEERITPDDPLKPTDIKKKLKEKDVSLSWGNTDKERLDILHYKKLSHERIDKEKIDEITSRIKLETDGIEPLHQYLFEKVGLAFEICQKYSAYEYFFDWVGELEKKLSAEGELGEASFVLEYYRALAGWMRLEYMEEKRDWLRYHEYKGESIKAIFAITESIVEKAGDPDLRLKAQFLNWLLHNDLCDNSDMSAMKKARKILDGAFQSKEKMVAYMDMSVSFYRIGEVYFARELFARYIELIDEVYLDPAERILFLDDLGRCLIEHKANAHFAYLIWVKYVDEILDSWPKQKVVERLGETIDMFYGIEEYDYAILLCRKAINSYPRHSFLDEFYYQIGLCWEGKAKKEKAIEWYRKLKVSFPASDKAAEAAFHIGDLYWEDGQYAQALNEFTIVNDRYDDSSYGPPARLRAAKIYVKRADWAAAKEELELFVENYPESDRLNEVKQILKVVSENYQEPDASVPDETQAKEETQ